MFKEYYRLAKPGIVYGNVFTTLAGFLFASRWHFGAILFFATMFGISLVIASACVFNNYLDRGIDAKMERTKKRALVSGTISGKSALIYGSLLGVLGIALLALRVNALTAIIAFAGFLLYVFVYGYAKRASHWGTVIGSIPGAVPILVGYTAFTNRLDVAALVLFLILVLWQMPHFYAIAMYRLEEYKAAGIPVLPAQKGMQTTKIHTVFYIAAFLIGSCALFALGYAGYTYFAVMLLVSLAWLGLSLQGFKELSAEDEGKWARRLFFFSLIVLVVFSIILSVAPILP